MPLDQTGLLAADQQGRGQTRAALLAAVLLALAPACLVVDTAYAWSCGWRPRNATPLAVAGVALALLVALGVMASRRGGRRWLATRLRQVALLAVVLAASWTTAEVVVSRMLGVGMQFHQHRPGLSRTMRPRAEVMRGISGSSRVTFNALGIRGRELPHDRAVRRILCVGGSTTLCLYLDDEETWPAILERALAASGTPAWVGNLGYNAYATRHHVRFTRASPILRQVDDVVFLIGFNDFMKALLGGPVDGGGGVVPMWQGSPIVGAIENLHDARRGRGMLAEDEVGDVYEARRELRRSSQVLTQLPDLAPHLDAYRRNVRAMVAHVRAAGARPIFASNPVKWRADASSAADPDLWCGRLGDGQVLSTSALRAGMDCFAAALRALCDELAVPFIDLSALSGVDAVFFDDCHFTEAGSLQVAGRIAAWYAPASHR